ncbi:RidA family protein [Bradyrhizobium sp. CCBAU 53421]|uniref:RidA family protein n=1 Tax=Bradyrhizobium sp. CCBAU 53421 TaxID=1325120 RepID=UPI00188BE1DF|nr:RidA family protein [Bradyrhizobium sp. CCBAU 53421]QOZ32794.1 RidA family protein [Bradyrhizobium sp. CCBAU 53421]
MSAIEGKLASLGLKLPARAPAMALYAPVSIDGGIAFVSGQLPRDGDRITVTGPVGREASLEAARDGARLALLRGLAALQHEIGSLDHVRRILKLSVYVQSAPDFAEQSAVADAASELLYRLFDDADSHARTAVGVAQLPKNASVELELIVGLAPTYAERNV